MDRFSTLSDMEIPLLCTQEDLDQDKFNIDQDLGLPGEFPFTRGVQHNMYRGKLWTMRQFSGFATAEETHARYRYLLEQGQTGRLVLLGDRNDETQVRLHERSLGALSRRADRRRSWDYKRKI